MSRSPLRRGRVPVVDPDLSLGKEWGYRDPLRSGVRVTYGAPKPRRKTRKRLTVRKGHT